MHDTELFASEAVEVIPGRYYVTALRGDTGSLLRSPTAAASICYSIDQELLYEPFYADFGPLNLGKTYRFCELTARLLRDAAERGKRLYLYCSAQPQQRANVAVLVGAFQVLLLGRPADEAYAVVAGLKPFAPFRDASCGVSCFHLQVQDCLRGLEKAVRAGFLDARDGAWRFDAEEYEHFEQVEHGDLNWIVPGKLVAFSGPAARATDYVGFRAMVPEDYWEYFRRRRVTAVVRLNKKVYERKRFLDGGFRHHELYFPDGSCPPTELLLRFLEIAEQEPGALAVHCKAGLGRTGVLICAYIMKHYRFTAEEVIGYIRICRPGSVIGPQQNYLREVQALMWREGDAWRAAHGPAPPPLAWSTSLGRATSIRAPASGLGADVESLAPAAATSVTSPPRIISSGTGLLPGKSLLDSTATAAAISATSTAAARDPASPPTPPPAPATPAASSSGGLRPAGAVSPPSPAAAARSSGDLSLMQYARDNGLAALTTGSGHHHYQGASAPAMRGHSSGGSGLPATPSSAASSVAAAAATYLGSGAIGSLASASSGHHARPPSTTRRSSSGSGGIGGLPPSAPRAASPGSRGSSRSGRVSGSGGLLSTSGSNSLLSSTAAHHSSSLAGATRFQGLLNAFAGRGGLGSGSGSGGHGPMASALLLSLGRPATQQTAAAAARPAHYGVSYSHSGASGGGGGASSAAAHGRSPSAPRERASSAAVAVSQSADYLSSSSGWRSPGTAGRGGNSGALVASGTASAAARPRSNIVRVLAPNGQPRKVPAAALQAGGAASLVDSNGSGVRGHSGERHHHVGVFPASAGRRYPN